MCVVIDANTFGEITDGNNRDFEPLRDWISQKGHTVIHGGSEYAKELSRHGKFLSYLSELDRAGNPPYRLDTGEVDNAEVFLKQNFVSVAYNDHHIAAILFVSGCRVVSSHDQGLHRLIQDCCSNNGKGIIKRLPKLTVNDPKIYQDRSHKSFLNHRSVSRCCV
jgi:hypothetical protein